MASQRPPWFRLPSLAMRPGAPAPARPPAPPPTPNRPPAPTPAVVRPTFPIRPPLPPTQTQEPARSPPPPAAASLPPTAPPSPPAPATAPPSAPVATPTPAPPAAPPRSPPAPAAAPPNSPVATPTPTSPAAPPRSPVAPPVPAAPPPPPAATPPPRSPVVPPVPQPSPPRAPAAPPPIAAPAPKSPTPTPPSPSTSPVSKATLTTSTNIQQSSSSVRTSPVPKPVATAAPSETVNGKAATPVSSPKLVKPSEKTTPAQSPKVKPFSHPPSPLTLPPAQMKTDEDGEREPKIEQKTVLVQETIDKPMKTQNAHNNGINASKGKREPTTKDKGTGKKLSDSEGFGMRVITLSGENKGAVMELSPSRKKNYPVGNDHNFEKNKNAKAGSSIVYQSSSESGEEGKSDNKEKANKAMTMQSQPTTAFLNSNVQVPRGKPFQPSAIWPLFHLLLHLPIATSFDSPSPFTFQLQSNFAPKSPKNMKIFNWVHRRFNHKDGLAQNAKKSGLIADDKQFLHENNSFSDVFDGWKGGILTIGTFGYDPLKDEDEQNGVSFYEEEPEKELLSALENESDHQITDSEEEAGEEEEEDDDDDEVNPLVYAVYAHDYEGLLEMKMEGNRVSSKDEFEFDAMIKNAKKERTTLAELFSADSEELQKKQPINKGEIIKEKSNYKQRLSFAKKLIGQDARPIHKLHRLMRRMLKRKIHPDLGLNKHNPINSKVVAKKCDTSESASLLPTQAIIINK
ncbi:hypothetical protein Pfo_001035 [Paulownia fortunei]|nr:hypothetical protein Pfo_001035 [Paulownia fortunei]